MEGRLQKEQVRLITEFGQYDTDTLTDALSIMARDVEDAMIQCGGIPGKDYTFIDIFRIVSEVHLASCLSKQRD
jgi:hypothetical protein